MFYCKFYFSDRCCSPKTIMLWFSSAFFSFSSVSVDYELLNACEYVDRSALRESCTCLMSSCSAGRRLKTACAWFWRILTSWRSGDCFVSAEAWPRSWGLTDSSDSSGGAWLPLRYPMPESRVQSQPQQRLWHAGEDLRAWSCRDTHLSQVIDRKMRFTAPASRSLIQQSVSEREINPTEVLNSTFRLQ